MEPDGVNVLLLPSEVAERLRIDRRTVYSWFRSGDLPGFKVGGRWRITATDFEEWVERHRKGCGQ